MKADQFIPMLAPTRIPCESEISWPMLASKKIDGIRGLMIPGKGLYSRAGRLLTNAATWKHFDAVQRAADAAGVVLDGELVIPGRRTEEIYSAITRGEIDGLKYMVFDSVDDTSLPFEARHERASRLLAGIPGVVVLAQRPIETWQELCSFYARVRRSGGEGLMIRRPDGLYRHGRCSMDERAIFKVRPIHKNSEQVDIPSGITV